MSTFDDIGVVIPVREGSSRVKKKVFLPFHEEMSLLEWKISQLKEVQASDRIFVSSNSEKIAGIAAKMGVEYIERSDYLSIGHQASFSEVITGVVRDVPTKHFAWTTVVVPLMRPNEYAEAFEKYMETVVNSNEHDSLVSVNMVKDYLWNANGPLNYQADKNHTISQDLPDIYRVTNGLYMRDKETTLEEGYFLGKDPYKHVVGKLSGIDIDEMEDYEMAYKLKELY
ncbi:cytidylyltransferase domain-containing protein [Halalkalibacter flavus]|uniref:acylneuraminate cytidylyltransferase family protein n=1 Tax=Halalkalibacter flavus TaxID=3090668 RepID=UPI002FCA6BF0